MGETKATRDKSLDLILKNLKKDINNLLGQFKTEFMVFFSKDQVIEFEILEIAINKITQDPENNIDINSIAYINQDLKFIQKNFKIIKSKREEKIDFELNNVLQALKKLNSRLINKSEDIEKYIQTELIAKEVEHMKVPAGKFKPHETASLQEDIESLQEEAANRRTD